MATITRKVDRQILPQLRHQYINSTMNSDLGVPLATGDMFLVEECLGKPAKYLWVETTAGTDLSIRINSRVVKVPMRDPILNNPQTPAIENSYVVLDTTQGPVIIGAAEVWEIKNVIPINDITFIWTAGSWEVVVA